MPGIQKALGQVAPTDPPPLGEARAAVRRLLAAVGHAKNVLICTHDNPDPDSIASAYALGELLRLRADAQYTLAHGGVLGRAENRAMARLLRIPLVSYQRVDLDAFDVLGLVDTQPGHGNHRLTPMAVGSKKLVCIDHHPPRPVEGYEPAYIDVGGHYGATSTKLVMYLEAAEIPFERPLATALFYGVKSDTRNLGREVEATDIWAYQHLIPHTDMAAISEIEHPRVPRGYFAGLARAIHRARLYEEIVACDLGEVYVPDLIAETADWLLLGEGVRWSIAVGEHEDNIFASIRVGDRRFSAGKLIRDVVATWPQGSAGGHGSMAGARIALDPETTKAGRGRLRRRLLRQLLRAAGAPARARGERFAVDSL